MTRQELCAALDAQLAAAQEQVCVLAVPLAGGVPLYERGAGRRAVSASTIKVFILLAALDEVRRGRLALDTPVAVTAEDILPDTGVFVDGPGMHPLEELLVWMIVLSDNTATNVLIGLLGAECINAAACSVGTKNTVLERKMLDWQYQPGAIIIPARRTCCACSVRCMPKQYSRRSFARWRARSCAVSAIRGCSPVTFGRTCPVPTRRVAWTV